MRRALALIFGVAGVVLAAVSCSGETLTKSSSTSFGGSATTSDGTGSHDPSSTDSTGATIATIAIDGGGGASCAGVTTCEMAGVTCGPTADGCGGILQCGSCAFPETCGGGGRPGQCGTTKCIPKTCAEQGASCGPVGDGCGKQLDCGGCPNGTTCGGSGVASACGVPSSCTNLCTQQVTCAAPSSTTTLTGTVLAPNGVDPLLNALVYVPNAPVEPFTPGVSCDQCGAKASGSPLVSAVSAVDGSFTLKNVPAGANIPLVIQLGRWRRQVMIPNVVACQQNAVSPTLTRLPKNKSEGDIPLMAFSTGSVDALECVMRKIGIDDAEFTAPDGGGRVHLYMGLIDPDSQFHQAAGGAKAMGSPNEDQLWSSQATLNQYDMVLFPCQADQTSRTPAVQQNLINYANAGGRIFATHFSYIWLYEHAPFDGTAAWHVEQHPSPPDQTGYVDMSFPKGQALAEWLMTVKASTTLGEIPLQVIRHDHDEVIAPSQSWMTIDDSVFPDAIVHYTFNTPVGAAPEKQCGRVLFDDFHVENVKASETTGTIFPAECAPGPMTAQEKLLEFMIFDLGSCITPDVPTCTPKTCTDLGVSCGPTGDGCGGVLQCGDCAPGQTCGGGGKPSVCGSKSCKPRSCADVGANCGPAGDGCGGIVQCGPCSLPQTCGGGGKASVCGGSGPL